LSSRLAKRHIAAMVAARKVCRGRARWASAPRRGIPPHSPTLADARNHRCLLNLSLKAVGCAAIRWRTRARGAAAEALKITADDLLASGSIYRSCRRRAGSHADPELAAAALG